MMRLSILHPASGCFLLAFVANSVACSESSNNGSDCESTGTCSPVSQDDASHSGSPGGDATSEGAASRASPLASVNAAVVLAKASADGGALKRIYVCNGYYTENLTLDATTNGLGIFGGLDCTDWTYNGGDTGLPPPGPGPA